MRYLKPAILFLLPFLAACTGSDESVRTDDLTGLYLGEGEGKYQDRICMVAAPSGAVRFGIVTLERDRSACSGLGRVEQAGAELRLVMAGEEECIVRARMDGTKIALLAAGPGSCSYYCSPGARLAGKAFEKTGDTAEAALGAADLVGNSLCG